MTKKVIDHVIVALDNMDQYEIINFLHKSKSKIPTVKIGLELFCKNGPSFVSSIYEKFGIDIFLDLKLHDIPNTVAKAVRALKTLPIKFLTLHLTGGETMVEMAVNEAKSSLPKTKLLGVTYLTSLDNDDFKSIYNFDKSQIYDSFDNLFNLAIKTKIQGLILPAKELEHVKKIELKNTYKFVKVSPGIRFADEIEKHNTQDQKMVEAPNTALLKGADYIVMGRSLTQAKNLEERIDQLSQMIIE